MCVISQFHIYSILNINLCHICHDRLPRGDTYDQTFFVHMLVLQYNYVIYEQTNTNLRYAQFVRYTFYCTYNIDKHIFNKNNFDM